MTHENLFLGVGFLFAFGFLHREFFWMFRAPSWVKVTGLVVGVDYASDGGDSPIVSYEFDGSKFKKSMAGFMVNPRIRDSIELIINPKRPNQAAQISSQARLIPSLLYLGCSAFFIFMSRHV